MPVPVRRTMRRPRRALLLPALLLAAGPAAYAADPGCTVDLLVEFSPTVTRPGSNQFLQTIVQGSGYNLRHVRTMGMVNLVRLTGPDATCDEGIQIVRRHRSVRSVDVDERQFRHGVPTPGAK